MDIYCEIILTCRDGEVQDAGCWLQQVGATWRQVSRNGHDGHAVTALLGTHNAVVLRMTQAAITGDKVRRGAEREIKGGNVGGYLKK